MTGILSLITYAPVAGIAAILALRFIAPAGSAKSADLAKWIALVTTLVTLALSLVMLGQFDR